MEVIIQPIFEAVKGIWKPITRYMDYALNPQKNLKELSKRVGEVCDRRDDSRNQMELAGTRKTPTKEYLRWLEDVNEIEKEMKSLEEKHLSDKRCFRGWFPNVSARVKFGEHVVEMIVQVKELQQKSKFEGGFLTDIPPEIVEMRPVPSFKAQTSFDRTLGEIMDCIRNEEIQKIGIWGMGGVGKTTLMTALNNMEEIKGMFHIVIWVTVSKSWSIKSLQDIIANRLSLNEETRKSEDEVCSKLFRELQRRKCLLLLDDVWTSIDLGKLGIPIIYGQRGCKIVLTTRVQSVCREMGTDKEVRVETLSEGEAWEIFHSKVGEIAMFPTIYTMAKDIVRECHGLPLALNVVGGALRRVKDVRVWRNILKKLKVPDISDANHPNDRVFDSLRVSYDTLSDANLRNSFLYCGLYPEDHQITKSELIEYWRAEGLLSSSSRGTLEEARDEGHQVLHFLTDASLLEESRDDDNHAKMHDVVRDLVLKMTSSSVESRHIVRAGLMSTDETVVVEDREWEEATRISFMHSECPIYLPAMPNCPKLYTLLLHSKRIYMSRFSRSRINVIPESFFNQMPILRVLNLSYTGILSLPCSISNLVNLRALFLQGCYGLKALPREVILLKRLEVLCLLRSVMKVVPAEIWELSSLKRIQFSHADYSRFTWTVSYFHTDDLAPGPMLQKAIFPDNAKQISQLGELEEVCVFSEPDVGSHQCVEVIAKELGKLPRLSSLEFNFETVNNLQHFLHDNIQWRDDKLIEFFFAVEEKPGSSLSAHEQLKDRWKRCLVYGGGVDENGSGNISVIPYAIQAVLLRSHFLVLHGNGEVRQLVSYLGAKNTCALRYCHVYGFDALENILDEKGVQEGAFANLEILKLGSLENLMGIWHTQIRAVSPLQLAKYLSTSSFTGLRELQILHCPKLKSLFSFGDEEIEDEVVSGDHRERGFEYELPKLKLLHLGNLPELVGCSNLGNVSLCCPLLEKVRIVDCPKLKTLLFGVNGAPDLKSIVGQQSWWDELEWEDEAAKSRLTPLFSPNWSVSIRPGKRAVRVSLMLGC